jgi:hypothetical protein
LTPKYGFIIRHSMLEHAVFVCGRLEKTRRRERMNELEMNL